MFEKFTDQARRLLSLARQEARRRGHEYIGTDHVLIGLIEGAGDLASHALRDAGLSGRSLRGEAEKLIPNGPSDRDPEVMPFTPGLNRVIDLARAEATRLGDDMVGTQHLLLGVLGQADGVAAVILTAFRVDRQEVRRRLLVALEEPPQS